MALSHRFIWGVNGVSVHGNLQYFDESSVVYSAGHTIVLCSTADKSQKFIAGSTESAGFSAVALCPSKRYVAVAEKADRASIVVYDLRTLRKRKVLSQPESACTRYASICFSQSNEQLVALTGDGAPAQLVCWRWSKGKVTAALPLAVSDNEPVRLEAAVVVAPVGGAAAAPALDSASPARPWFSTGTFLVMWSGATFMHATRNAPDACAAACASGQSSAESAAMKSEASSSFAGRWPFSARPRVSLAALPPTQPQTPL
mmetsp:Transcript_28651/g.96488  ORF Transcript_28651/g.96488 Transcript_28651/m.96488 type:complete len:259 (-) Transcript_28651:613-1389(-)